MNAQDLKNSILQLAIQGKLVEQRKEEGTAKELLEKIKAEKEQLIKEGKIKKEKPLPEITEDEIPFDIPENWEWVRLDSLTLFIKAGGDKPKDFSEVKTGIHTVPVIANGIQNDGIIGYTQVATINDPCITVSGRGTIGFSCIRTEPFCPIVRLLVLNISKEVSQEYIQIVLTALLERGVGTSIQQLTVPMLEPKLIPLPPLEEQKRIVAKIEELMPYIEQYGEAHSKLEMFNKKFPENMQKSILQYAIQGKLVEQREEEGTAEELYQKIQEEKIKLIKEGKIKKEKPLPEITEDEIPFEIPENWKWVRLKTVVYNRGQMIPNDKFSYIDIGSINNKEQKLNSDENIIEPCKAPSRARKIVDYGDILYSTVRPYLHNMCIIDRDFKHQPIASTGFAVMTCYNGIYNKFLFYYLLSPSFDSYANSNENSKGVAYPAINDERLYKALIPLPPLEEQKRIVAKIEEMLPYCQQLVK